MADYTPSGATVERFHLDPAFMRIIMGPLGSGKTTACCYEILRRAVGQEQNKKAVRQTRWLVCRNTIPELETTTLPSWEQHFGMELGPWKRSSPITHSWRFALADGSKVEADIYFLGLDGPDAAAKIRGMELTGCWMNEAKDIPRSVFDMVTGRVGRYPPKRDGGPTWSGVFGDTNMPDDDHWLYDLAERVRPDNWSFYRQPGGVIKVGEQWTLSALAENLLHLPENYYKNQLGGKSEEWIRVYLASEYGYVADGRPIFPEYSDIHHVADLEPIKGEPIFIGADLGLTPAAVFCQRDAWGRLLILAELTTSDVGSAKFAKGVRQFFAHRFPGHVIGGGWGDPIGEKRSSTDDNERTTFQIMAMNGLRLRPAPGNNQMVIRREAVAASLTRLIDGKPGLIIDRSCLKLRGGMAGKYCFKRVNKGGSIFSDSPNKNEYSHVCEAMQYLLLGLGEGRDLLTDKNIKIRKPNVITGTKNSHHVVNRHRVKSDSGRSFNYYSGDKR